VALLMFSRTSAQFQLPLPYLTNVNTEIVREIMPRPIPRNPFNPLYIDIPTRKRSASLQNHRQINILDPST